MAERWQQWMPFHIDKFRGSPDVQAMHPIARCGYIYLLAAQWQMSDCTLPNDADSLSALSGLGDELWEKYGAKILRKFGTDEIGNICNVVLRREWQEAKRVFEARQASAHRTNTVRSPQRSPSRPADTQTLTGTVTSTEKQKPSRVKREGPTKTEQTKTRHEEFKGELERYWKSKNPTAEMSWDGAEGKQLGMWLSASPNTTIEQFTGYLRNRYRSEGVNHSERVSRWIGGVSKYASGPLDKFGKPLSTTRPVPNALDEVRARNAAAAAEMAHA